MDEQDLAALRARHRHWDISADDNGSLTARLGGYHAVADTIARLEQAIGDYETGRTRQ